MENLDYDRFFYFSMSDHSRWVMPEKKEKSVADLMREIADRMEEVRK